MPSPPPMHYCADLHIHSPYSRGTSRTLSLGELETWARIKGVNLAGTGDFTHPAWRSILKEELVPDGRGFFALKDRTAPPPALDGFRTADIPVRFCLSAEVSSIYKKNGATRKVHSCVYAPDFESADRLSARLGAIGNVTSDGRPILGLDAARLVEIVKDVSPDCHFIPAHIWTPWFSVFGAHSGFDSLEECFGDMLPHIFALETGLSSDPLMNWRISALDRFTLVSNSDAHSGAKLMREANLFDADFSYAGLFGALETRRGFAGTIEFFPEEGKYHYDGHRQCHVSVSPEGGGGRALCPVCGKPLTIGVMHRVLELADRAAGVRPEGHPGFRYAIPLPELLSELVGTGPATKGVMRFYKKAISAAGNERTLLLDMPLDDIRRSIDPWLALAVSRLRENKVRAEAGYDGEYGVVRVFEEGELDRLRGQAELWGAAPLSGGRVARHRELFEAETQPAVGTPAPVRDAPASPVYALNPEQTALLDTRRGACLVLAGPGTGKTRSLVAWIEHQVTAAARAPRSVLALTFTNKARDELVARLAARLGDRAAAMTVSTFHALCWDVISTWYPEVKGIYDETGRRSLLRFLYPRLTARETEALADRLERFLDGTLPESTPELDEVAAAYQEALKGVRGVDVAGLVTEACLMFTGRPEILAAYRERYQVIAVDEFQDLNRMQYRLLTLLIGPGAAAGGRATDKSVLVIGDPDQAVYGFRGGDPALCFRFQNDYQARYATLSRNYRSTGVIVGAARGLAARNALKSGLKLVAGKPGGEKITAAAFPDQAAEAAYIARLVHDLVGGADLNAASTGAPGRYSFGDIAVLARTHRALEPALKACVASGVPAAWRAGRALLSEPSAALLAETFRYFLHRGDVVSFQNIVVRFLPGFDHEALAAVVAVFQEHRGDPAALLSDDRVRAALSGVERGALEALFRFLEFVEAEIEAQGVGKGIFLLLEKMREGKTAADELKIADQALVDMAAGYGNDLGRFVRDALLSRREADFGFPVERVSFLTFHAAKGLEFPVVIIAAAEEGITPHGKAGGDPDEERRLFYVALTRAGDRAYITHALRREVFGKERAQQPSRFIDELPAEYVEVVESRARKKAYEQPTLF